jgi:hypothetical protein
MFISALRVSTISYAGSILTVPLVPTTSKVDRSVIPKLHVKDAILSPGKRIKAVVVAGTSENLLLSCPVFQPITSSGSARNR